MLRRFFERDPRLPQQPETPIALDAQDILKSWGFDRNQIRGIQQEVKIFDGAYGNCVQKITALETVHKRGRHHETEIILPPITDDFILQVGGNCDEIAHTLAKKIRATNVLDAVNQQRSLPIELRLVAGNNSTHFKGGSHVWLGLVEKGTTNHTNMVVVDGSYQVISRLETSGYTARKSDMVEDVPQESERILPWSLIDIKDSGINVEHLSNKILGLSMDGSVSFSIGFAVAWNFVYENIPFIRVGHANGTDEAVFLVNPSSGNVNYEFSKRSFSLSPSANEELQQMLEITRRMQFVSVD